MSGVSLHVSAACTGITSTSHGADEDQTDVQFQAAFVVQELQR